MADPKIIVGVDGSAGSLGALSMALEEARPALVKKVEDHAAELLEVALASIDLVRARVEVSSLLVVPSSATTVHP